MENPHYQRLSRTITLATQGLGFTKTNPLVGACLFENQRLVGEGFHQTFGGDHAEIVAFKQCTSALSGFKQLYVSLEPCAHYGKTPPCTHEIINRGIQEVYVGCLDPNPKVSGKGIQLLQKHGVKVTVLQKNEEFLHLIKPFSKGISQQIPYVILKWAQSHDGYLGTHGKRINLSNHFSFQRVHRIRNNVDAIFVGKNTLLIDNPKLNSRIPPYNHPRKIIFASPELQKKRASLFMQLNQNDICVLKKSETISLNPNCHIFQSSHYDYHLIWPEILRHLYHQQIGTLLVEGGADILNFFIQNDWWDEAFVIKTPINLKTGVKAPTINGRSFLIDNLQGDKWFWYHKDTETPHGNLHSLFI